MRDKILAAGMILLGIAVLLPFVFKLFAMVGIFDFQGSINIRDILRSGRKILEQSEIKLQSKYADELVIVTGGGETFALSDLNRWLVEQAQESLQTQGASQDFMPPVFYLALAFAFDLSDPKYPVLENYRLLQATVSVFEKRYDVKNYAAFLQALVEYTKSWTQYAYLLEPAIFLEAQNHFFNYNYSKTHHRISLLSPDWMALPWFQEIYLYTLWQEAYFDQLEELLSTDKIADSLSDIYSQRLTDLKQANSVIPDEPLGAVDSFRIYVLLAIMIVVLGFALKDIVIYFSIFFSYKYSSSDKRLKLLKKTVSKTKSDFSCPICRHHIDKEIKQPYHENLAICEDDEEILLPFNRCASCGATLDQYLNCPVCGFNQKGELNYVFSFDLLSQFILILYLVSLILVLLKAPFSHVILVDYKALKIFSSSVFILGIIVSMLPFIFRDLNLKRHIFFSYERLLFVSLDKFFRFMLLYFCFVWFSPVYAAYQTSYFFSILSVISIIFVTYGLLRHLTFGQEHKRYYENQIKDFFIGGVLVMGTLSLLLNLMSITHFSTADPNYQRLIILSLANNIIFFVIGLIIVLNETPLRKVRYSWHFWIQEHFRSIMSFLQLGLAATIFFIFRWVFDNFYTNLSPLFFQGVLLFLYRVIIQKQTRENVFTLSYLHNFYIFIFGIVYLAVSYLAMISNLSLYADIHNFWNIVKTTSYLAKLQTAQLVNLLWAKDTLSFFTPAFLILTLILLLNLFATRLKNIYRLIRPQIRVDFHEARRVSILLSHLDLLSDAVNRQIEFTNLKPLLLEQQYLLETSTVLEGNRPKLGKRINQVIDNAADPEKLKIKFQAYEKQIRLVKDYSLSTIAVPADKPYNLLSREKLPVPEFRLITAWNRSLRDDILKKQEFYLQITESIFMKSLKLYAKALSRFYHSAEMYKSRPYSISQFQYFLIYFSDTAFFPPSLEKLFAMKFHGKKMDDFVYIYFCDNYPQLKTANYLTREPDVNILEKIKETGTFDDLKDYIADVDKLRRDFLKFCDEIDKMGYRCEFYPVDTTIKLQRGVRTKFTSEEKDTIAGGLVAVKVEYYKAKFALVIEKTNLLEQALAKSKKMVYR